MSKRIAASLLLIATLGGCTPEIETCETLIKNGLRTPSTYDRIDVSTTWVKEGEEPKVFVSFEYDAENVYGAPIRYQRLCSIPLVDGRPQYQKAELFAPR